MFGILGLSLPREERTPINQATAIATLFSVRYSELYPDKPGEAFVEEVFRPVMDAESPDGDRVLIAAKLHNLEEGLDRTRFGHAAATISCAYLAQAIEAEVSGKRDVAWSCIADAAYWYSAIGGAFVERGVSENALRTHLRKANDKSHEENRTMKAEVHRWYAENQMRFKSMDSAAEAVAGKIVPVKFKTARAWIGEWVKIQRAVKAASSSVPS